MTNWSGAVYDPATSLSYIMGVGAERFGRVPDGELLLIHRLTHVFAHAGSGADGPATDVELQDECNLPLYCWYPPFLKRYD